MVMYVVGRVKDGGYGLLMWRRYLPYSLLSLRRWFGKRDRAETKKWCLEGISIQQDIHGTQMANTGFITISYITQSSGFIPHSERKLDQGKQNSIHHIGWQSSLLSSDGKGFECGLRCGELPIPNIGFPHCWIESWEETVSYPCVTWRSMQQNLLRMLPRRLPFISRLVRSEEFTKSLGWMILVWYVLLYWWFFSLSPRLINVCIYARNTSLSSVIVELAYSWRQTRVQQFALP